MGENKKDKRVPTKVAWYFPVTPRLKRLFANKANAELLRWHADDIVLLQILANGSSTMI
jgi:hypothetical protein